MDAKQALAITDIAMTAAAKGIMKDEALKRIHGAISVIARRQEHHLRLNCDQMSRSVRTAVSKVLRGEGYYLKTATDPDVEGRVWFEIDWQAANKSR